VAELSLEDRKDGIDAGLSKEEQDMAWFEKRYQERVRIGSFVHVL
jgi:hypothetical protein